MKSAAAKRVVLLVDHKKRDLMVAALIAHHFKRRGIECFLEPLEAYRGVLAAHRPHLIIFNHLFASHLVDYSQRLAEMGVATTVLLNEGLGYGEAQRDYVAGKHHKGGSIDTFFCWNQPSKEALERHGFGGRTRIEVVGPPRFDYYCKPWSRIFDDYSWPGRGRPKVLVCTNFGFAKFFHAPEEGRKVLLAWAKRIPSYGDWWSLIETHHREQQRFFLFLDALVRSRRFDVVLRPHPREDLNVYRSWLARLPPELRGEAHMDATSNITSLILACDLRVGCENCNTTLESWIAGKPTVDLVFERHPVFYNAAVGALSPECGRPEEVVATIEGALADRGQEKYLAGRRAHLAKWCNSPGGKASERIVEIIAERLSGMPEPDWSKLELADRRRALKLKALQKLGKAYNYQPLIGLRGRLLGGRHKLKADVYDKAVTQKDVSRALALIESRLARAA